MFLRQIEPQKKLYLIIYPKCGWPNILLFIFQLCPPTSKDFRTLQCESFNGIKYRGEKHEWVPVISDGKCLCSRNGADRILKNTLALFRNYPIQLVKKAAV